MDTLFAIALPSFSSSLWKSSAFFIAGIVYVSHHGSRPQIVILCWPQINPFFAGETVTSLLGLSQHIGGPYRNSKKTPDDSGADKQTDVVPTLSPLLLIAFLANPGVWGKVFLLDLSFLPLCILKFSRPYLGAVLRFSLFWLRLSSVWEYSFCTLAWLFEVKLFQLKLCCPSAWYF